MNKIKITAELTLKSDTKDKRKISRTLRDLIDEFSSLSTSSDVANVTNVCLKKIIDVEKV